MSFDGFRRVLRYRFTTCFVVRFLNLRAQDVSQELIWIQMMLLRDEKSHGQDTQHTQRESTKKKLSLSEDLGLRNPVMQKPFSPKCGIPFETSIVARVLNTSVASFTTQYVRYQIKLGISQRFC